MSDDASAGVKNKASSDVQGDGSLKKSRVDDAGAAAGAVRIDPARYPAPQSMLGWVEANKERLQPPVCNALMYSGANFKVMLVGGPNKRSDYHVNEGAEFFVQLKADMLLPVVDGGDVARRVLIKEGHCFMLPPRIPHSPQRYPNSVGLVIERDRKPEQLDTLRWYCRGDDGSGCGAIVYQDQFHCVDLGTQLKPVIERYYGDSSLRTCAACGRQDEAPKQHGDTTAEQDSLPITEADAAAAAQKEATFAEPVPLAGWIEANMERIQPPECTAVMHSAGYRVMLQAGPCTSSSYLVNETETFFWQQRGQITLRVVDGGEFRDVVMAEGECYLLPGGFPYSAQRGTDTVGMVIELEREPEQLDALQWYCQSCNATVHREKFHSTGDVAQHSAIVERVASDTSLRTCSACGHENPV